MEEEKEESARRKGVSRRRNSTCQGLGTGENAKYSKKLQEDSSKRNEGECGKRGGSLSQDFPPLKGRASEGFSSVGLACTHLSGHLTVTDYLPGQAWGGIWGGEDKQEKDMRWVREATQVGKAFGKSAWRRGPQEI